MAHAFVGEVVLGSDVVVDGDDVVGQADDLVERIRAHGVVQEHEVGVGTGVALYGVDPSLEAGFDVLGEDIRGDAHRVEVTLKLEHLPGYGVATRRTGVELMNSGVPVHRVAIIA
ncbi:MAG: hypothetical protein ACLPVF_01570 [Acidimicrobiales bacterium]